jgi:ubiquitin thioesterase OTU1
VETGEFDVTVFEIDERGLAARDALEKLGKKLKGQHYYTDTATFALKCNVCGSRLQGEKEASKHAMTTGHSSFGEF